MNEDSRFDELVKEKAEKKKFRYSPLFWFLFAKKAGVALFSVTQIVGISVVAVALLGGGTYAVVKSVRSHKTPTSPQTEIVVDTISHQEEIPVVVPEDTVITEIAAPEPETQQQPQPTPVPVAKPEPEPVATPAGKPKQTTEVDTPKTVRKGVPKYNIRILEINPDTIPTNY